MLKHLEKFYLNPDQSIADKYAKFLEESQEVVEAWEMMLDCRGTQQAVADELVDNIHASLNLLKAMDSKGYINLESTIRSHEEKLKRYVASGRHSL